MGIYIFRGRCYSVFVADFRQVFISRVDVLHIKLNVLKVHNKETGVLRILSNIQDEAFFYEND